MSAAGTPYEQQVRRWREARVARLQSPSGWLTLVDRIVLDQGENAIPIGTVTLTGNRAVLRVRPDVQVTLAGAEVREHVMRSDEEGAPDKLLAGGRSYELIRRGDAFAVRVKDPNAPALRAFAGLRYFPIDPRWRIIARFQRYEPPRHTHHEFDIGTGWRRLVPGLAHFVVEGRDATLEPVLEEDANRLFFVFADATNASETYPAGRFLYAEPPAPGATEVVLDFNTAFNPPCAFTAYATCPVTPARNRLPFPVPAGERRYDPVPL